MLSSVVTSTRWARLRRRRGEIEYPTLPGDAVSADEAQGAIGTALRLLKAGELLSAQLGFFR